MLHYANAFTCSADEGKNEFIIAFKQRRPVLEDDGTMTGLTSDTVAEIVLSRGGAEALRQLLDGAINS